MSNCSFCGDDIRLDFLNHTYYDINFPDIPIGPFCERCIPAIRFCMGCQKPIHKRDAIYHPNGYFFCTECTSSMETCSECGAPTTEQVVHRGRKYCKRCFRKKFAHCNCCNTSKSKKLFFALSYDRKSQIHRLVWNDLFQDYDNICTSCFEKKRGEYSKKEVSTCQACNCSFIISSNEKRYCHSCLEQISPCSNCGEKDHKSRNYTVDSSFSNRDGDSIAVLCRKCAKKSRTCACGRLSKKIKTIKGAISDFKLCLSCVTGEYRECESCLSFYSAIDFSGSSTICKQCTGQYEKNKCSKCGRIRDPDGYCRVCDNTQIYYYSFRPRKKFQRLSKEKEVREKIFFGIENEVTFGESYTNRDRSLKLLYSRFDPTELVTKSDSSIRGYGYEIVTQPMSFGFLRKFCLSKLFSGDEEKSESCGMHVHVSRSAFISDIHIFKIIKLIHDNKDQINIIAGRDYNHYQGRFYQKISSVVKSAKQGRAERATRVNLQNPNTIEFRLFAGATNEFEIRYRIEFLHALIEWSKEVSIVSVTMQNFIEYVRKNAKKYHNFVKFLNIKMGEEI